MQNFNGMTNGEKGQDEAKKFENVIRIDEGEIRSHVDEVVRESVEETLNGLLDRLCQAKRYERSASVWTVTARYWASWRARQFLMWRVIGVLHAEARKKPHKRFCKCL